jgi:RNA polymerase sigma-32 factor
MYSMNMTFNPNSMALYGAHAPAASLQTYIDWVNRVPMLTAEEEQQLATQLKTEQDLGAARRLVMAHLRFVVRIARGYNGYGLSQADLIQEGNIGLMKAVKRFDPSVGVRLASFAVHWIKAEMHEFIIRNWRIVKIATTKAQRKLFFKMRSLSQRLGWSTAEDIRYVAETLSVPESEVRHMELRMSSPDTSFDAPTLQDDHSTYTPEDYLAAPHANPALEVERNEHSSHQQQALQNAIADLDARSQIILRKRWLQDSKATLQELSEQFGVSVERVRQIEKQAMKKIKSML